RSAALLLPPPRLSASTIARIALVAAIHGRLRTGAWWAAARGRSKTDKSRLAARRHHGLFHFVAIPRAEARHATHASRDPHALRHRSGRQADRIATDEIYPACAQGHEAVRGAHLPQGHTPPDGVLRRRGACPRRSDP